MIKLWMLNQGRYADFRVIGVFSTRENAELVQRRLQPSYEDSEIEEVEVDSAVKAAQSGEELYVVHLAKQGDPIKAWGIGFYADGTTDRFSLTKISGNYSELHCCLWAFSMEEAVARAESRRDALVQSGAWERDAK